MPDSSSLASADEIHAYLVEEMNHALRRPGMYGYEGALRMVLDHLLFVEGQPEARAEQEKVWEEGGAWSSTGVTGAIRRYLPDRSRDGMASVYGEFARRRGWLRPERVLTADEYRALRGRVRAWAGADRVWGDVVDAFGEPSVLFGGTSPLYGKTLSYLTEDPDEPMVSFHLWNGTTPDTDSSWPPEHEQPLLLAVRLEGGVFSESFTFTPEGERQRRELTGLFT
ncbi:hypothetical protein [Streptomyces sp. NRRL B-1347]|uniref:hypothetical protein n=1 Tax=Streptomyces sp. NRRL B-1347 TaxID=1476877 RepID=UPI00056280CD|nr:hypothetical protein [Streptomyces sp. NRRL B-1347]